MAAQDLPDDPVEEPSAVPEDILRQSRACGLKSWLLQLAVETLGVCLLDARPRTGSLRPCPTCIVHPQHPTTPLALLSMSFVQKRGDYRHWAINGCRGAGGVTGDAFRRPLSVFQKPLDSLESQKASRSFKDQSIGIMAARGLRKTCRTEAFQVDMCSGYRKFI